MVTSSIPCAKVARGQTGLQKAEGELTYHHVGTKPLIPPLQIQAGVVTPPQKNPPLSIQQQEVIKTWAERAICQGHCRAA